MRSLVIFVFSLSVLTITGSLTECIASQAWQFKPSVSVSETYNSNIYSISNETDDFITGIGVGFSTSYAGTKTGLNANYLTTWNSYADHPKLNVFTHDGSINIDITKWLNNIFSNLSINVSEDFTYSPDLKDYYFNAEKVGSASLSNYGIRTERGDSFRNAGSINVRFSLSQNRDLNVKYSNLLTEYSDPALIDNISNNWSLGTSYKTRRDTLYGDVGIRQTKADDVDINGYFITTGLRHQFSPVTQGEFSIGGEMTDNESTGQTSNVRGALRLSKTAEFVSYHIGYTRELNSVTGVSTSPVVSQTVYINLSGRHSRQISSSVRTSFSINNSLKGDDVDTKSYNVTAEATYTISTWLTGSFSASHFVQESESISAQDMERNLIMLQFAASWGS